jgi:hypothetical protein
MMISPNLQRSKDCTYDFFTSPSKELIIYKINRTVMHQVLKMAWCMVLKGLGNNFLDYTTLIGIQKSNKYLSCNWVVLCAIGCGGNVQVPKHISY